MSLASFIVGLVGPLMARWLASVGLSLVVLTGLTAAVSTLRSTLISNASSLPLSAMQLAGLFGIWHLLGMILGAVTFSVTWASTKGFWSLART